MQGRRFNNSLTATAFLVGMEKLLSLPVRVLPTRVAFP